MFLPFFFRDVIIPLYDKTRAKQPSIVILTCRYYLLNSIEPLKLVCERMCWKVAKQEIEKLKRQQDWKIQTFQWWKGFFQENK